MENNGERHKGGRVKKKNQRSEEEEAAQ